MAVILESLNVLVADDNAHMRALLRSLLQTFGVKEIVECNDGGAAFAALREFKADFALIDLNMEPVDGIEFTRRVRTRRDSPNAHLPIVMITGYTERSRVESARDAGVSEFLAKPITAQKLLSRINEVFERPRPFVAGGNYSGPDRRRRRYDDYDGPQRRRDDR